jgi:hypothetical protein
MTTQPAPSADRHYTWADYDTVWSVARRILLMRGWTRGTHIGQQPGCLCVGEAIATALTGDRMNFYTHVFTTLADDHPLKQAVTRFADYVKQTTGLLGRNNAPPHERVMAWNDDSTRLQSHVIQTLNQLHAEDKPNHTRARFWYEEKQEPRMPSTIYPHETNRHGETTECQLCGEPADEEMGEFTLPQAHPNATTSDRRSVVAHGQCGIDHGLETA